ncbi:hypothetical protein NLU13_8254 [Sarocladium strictum]|uniref:Fungal N-terminal domain-containing protein n=1 Tax=Sarocladium strictum TaxID=5046 RepID=A0AA39GBC7_SARSR|nr:hypothetical protein NLU13_8254 [Sarocladium strictum]
MDPASAIVGFTVVGVQLGATALKLKRLWGQMRDLPDDVEELLASLERVSSLLTRAEPLTSPRRPEAGLLLACLENCQGSRRRLEDMAGELEAKLGRKGGLRRKMMALRTVMNKDLLEKYKSQLRDALHMFSFALEISSNENSHQSLRLLQSEALCSSMRYETLEKHAQNHSAILKSISDQEAHKAKSLEYLEATTTAVQQALREEETQIVSLKDDIEVLLSGRFSDRTVLHTILHHVQALPAGKPGTPGHGGSSQRGHQDEQTNRRSIERGILEYCLGKAAVARKDTDDSWTFRLETPKWWSGVAYELTYRSQLSSYIFRVYNVVSSDSEIVQSVTEGDTAKVRELFQARLASPYDVDDEGQSLLHYAAYHMQPEVCKLLLQKGLGNTLLDPIGPTRSTPLKNIIMKFRNVRFGLPDERRDQVVELFQTFLRINEPPPLEMVYDYLFALEHNNQQLETFRDVFMVDYYERPVEERAACVRLGVFTDVSCSSTLQTLLCRDDGQASSEDIAAATRAKLSLLHSSAVCLGRRFGEEVVPFYKPVGYARFYTADWSDWVEDLVKQACAEDLTALETMTPPDTYHQVPQWTGTPITSLIGGLACWLFPHWRLGYWDRAVQGVLREWIRILQAGGLTGPELLAYGRHERAVLHSDVGCWKGVFDADSARASETIVRPTLTKGTLRGYFTVPEYGGCRRTDLWRPIRILNIAYGLQPSDWRLHWVVEFEYMAYEFWQLIERRESVMPGAWVDG